VSEAQPEVRLARGLGRGTSVVSLSGSFDSAATSPLRQALLEALRAGSTVVVDLREVTFLDSCVLGVLVAAHRRASADSGRLLLVHPPERVLRLLRLTGLTGLLEVREEPWPATTPVGCGTA
jgi:anti-anti-sigma factor